MKFEPKTSVYSQKIRRFLPTRPDPFTLLSVLFFTISFPPWDLWPLVWICLVPWFFAIERAPNSKAALSQGFWLGYGCCLGAFFWVAYVLKEFGTLPWSISILGLLLFSIVGQIQFFLVAPMIRHSVSLRKSSRTISIGMGALLALSYGGTDWVLPKLFSDSFGYGLYSTKYMKQTADLGGVFLLTFLVFFVNDTVWTLMKNWKNKRQVFTWIQPGIALILCLAAWTYGYFRYHQIEKIVLESRDGIYAASIQGMIGDFEKVAAERGATLAAYKIIDTFTEMSDESLQDQPIPDVIIWPETAFPTTFRSPHSQTEFNLNERVEKYVKTRKTHLLFGGYAQHGETDFNAVFLLDPAGMLQTYKKHILLPFGEFIPGANQFTYIKEAFPQVGNFGLGEGATIFELPYHGGHKLARLTPVICYEALFSDYLIESARKKAQIIMNVTNDSWFGTWGEPQLHLALSTFRSIETRLPMVRTTNTGISAVVLPTGEMSKSTNLGEKTVMKAFVPITPEIPTLLKSWGNWFGPFSLLIGIGGFSAIFIHFNSRRNQV